MAAILSRDYLSGLPYAELRRLAKANGIRANLTKDMIIDQLLNAHPEANSSTGDQMPKLVQTPEHNVDTTQPRHPRILYLETPRRIESRSRAPEPEARPSGGAPLPFTPGPPLPQRDSSRVVDSCAANTDVDSPTRDEPGSEDIEAAEQEDDYFMPYSRAHSSRKRYDNEPTTPAPWSYVHRVLENLHGLSTYTSSVRVMAEHANRSTKEVLRGARETRRRIEQAIAQNNRTDTFVTFARRVPPSWSYQEIWGHPIPLRKNEYGEWEEIPPEDWPIEGKGCGPDKPLKRFRKPKKGADVPAPPALPNKRQLELIRAKYQDHRVTWTLGVNCDIPPWLSEAPPQTAEDDIPTSIPRPPVPIWRYLSKDHKHPKKRINSCCYGPNPAVRLEPIPDPVSDDEPPSKRRRLRLSTGDDGDEPHRSADVPPDVVSQYLSFLHCRFPRFLSAIAGDAYGELVNAQAAEEEEKGKEDEEEELFAGEDPLAPRPGDRRAGVPPDWYREREKSPVEPVVEGVPYMPALKQRERHPEIPLIGPDVHKYRRKRYFVY